MTQMVNKSLAKEEDDAEIWEVFRNGSPAKAMLAISHIYNTHYRALYKFGRVFAEPEEASDAVHDLFLYLYTRREHLGETNKILPYLCTALKRLILARQKKAEKEIPQSSLSQEDEIHIEYAPEEAGHTILSWDDLQRLYEACDKLPPKNRDAIVLHYWGKLSFPKIGKRLGMKADTVKKMVYRTLKHLKGVLNEMHVPSF